MDLYLDSKKKKKKELERMEETWKYFISIPLCVHTRVFHLDRARCDLNSRSDHAPSFLSTLMVLHRRKITFFSISPLLSLFFLLLLLLLLSRFVFFGRSINASVVCSSNDDNYIDGKRWVDTFEQLIGRQDSFLALCLEQLLLPLIVSQLRLALRT